MASTKHFVIQVVIRLLKKGFSLICIPDNPSGKAMCISVLPPHLHFATYLYVFCCSVLFFALFGF